MDIRIGNAAEYDNLGEGFVIEKRFGDHYAIPAWDEMGLADFGKVFATEAEAQQAIDDNSY